MGIKNLFKITPDPFALDLSDRSIKIAKFSLKRNIFSLENFGEFEIAEGIMEDGAILDEGKLAGIIKKSLSKLKGGEISSQHVACSLPESKTYLRVVQLPAMKEEEVSEAIRWEVEANIPVPLAEIYYDWQIIPQRGQEKNHLDVLVSAAPKNIVDSYVSILEKSGLKPMLLEPESVAISRSLIKDKSSTKPTLIVDVGRNRTSFVIYAGGSLRFSTSVNLSGAIITKNIMRDMKMGEGPAVRLKEEVGINKKENLALYEAVLPALVDFKQQIKNYINFYSPESSHVHGSSERIRKVLLVGGGARIKGFDAFLSSALDMPVEIGNPWVNILNPPLKEIPELSFRESTRYATAFGLAMNVQKFAKP